MIRVSSGSTAPVIIVKKIKKGHEAHHGGAWKVAYADFVTAMMALFIVLWLLSSSERVQKTVGGYFRDPRGKGRMVGTTVSGAGEAMQVKLDEMDSLKKKIEKAMAQEMKDFDRLKDFINITVTEEGLRIELVESASGIFFDSGSAVPSPAGAEIFAKLAQEVGALPESGCNRRPYRLQAIQWHSGLFQLGAFRRSRQRRPPPDDGPRPACQSSRTGAWICRSASAQAWRARGSFQSPDIDSGKACGADCAAGARGSRPKSGRANTDSGRQRQLQATKTR